MLSYATIGTNDYEKAVGFYNEVLGCLGAFQLQDRGDFCLWGKEGHDGVLAVCAPFDGQPATVGNGSMFGVQADSEEQVRGVYEKALALGGTDEGPPGLRGDGAVYSAYFRDLDGNKLAVFFRPQ